MTIMPKPYRVIIMTTDSNIVWHAYKVSKEKRQQQKSHKSCVIWFTGFSGSGKSTIANSLDQKLYSLGIQSYVLDGDNIRHGLNNDLGFTKHDRTENIRRIGEVAKLFVDSGTIVLTAFISPFREDREVARLLFPAEEFLEVYVKCPLQICEHRDPKGLYKKARKGEIPEFTGISSPYEPPLHADIAIETDQMSIEESVNHVIQMLKDKQIIL